MNDTLDLDDILVRQDTVKHQIAAMRSTAETGSKSGARRITLGPARDRAAFGFEVFDKRRSTDRIITFDKAADLLQIG